MNQPCIKSIVIPSFRAETLRHRDDEGGGTSFVMFCELMSIKTLDSIGRRLRASFLLNDNNFFSNNAEKALFFSRM